MFPISPCLLSSVILKGNPYQIYILYISKSWSVVLKNKKKESMSCHAFMFSCFGPAMLLLTKSAPTKGQRNFSWVLSQKVKKTLFTFTVNELLFTNYCSRITVHWHYSLFTVHNIVHSKFCLFKGGYPLSFCFKFFLHRFLS